MIYNSHALVQDCRAHHRSPEGGSEKGDPTQKENTKVSLLGHCQVA